MLEIKVNQKEIIKRYNYYHCFQLSDSSYALFDIKMDMPIMMGSLAIIQTILLPLNSIVFLYKSSGVGCYEKGAKKTIEVKGEGKHTKPPLRCHYLKNESIIYHHFKLSNVLSVIFDEDLKLPIAYGSNQKIQAIINKVNKTATIFYYKEDPVFKHSFKMYMTYTGKG
jgi:hypothetical protein